MRMQIEVCIVSFVCAVRDGFQLILVEPCLPVRVTVLVAEYGGRGRYMNASRLFYNDVL